MKFQFKVNAILIFFLFVQNFNLKAQNECIQRIKKEALTIDTISYSSGTGFFINNEGYILTNKHVVGDHLDMRVKFRINDREIERPAKLVCYLMEEDIAVIKIDVTGLGLPSVPYSFIEKDLNIGSEVYTLGFPKPGILGESMKLTEGIVNSTSGFQDNKNEYQVSAQIQPGNSGSPMFDSRGNIKGIIYASYESGQNVNYAIKTDRIIELLKAFKIGFSINESNTSFSQNISKYQWSVCLISIKSKKTYYSEFIDTDGTYPFINPNFIIDKSRCDNYKMNQFLEYYDQQMDWPFFDIGLNNLESALLWSYMCTSPISFEVAQKNNALLQIGAFENIIENHDKANLNNTRRIFEDGPFSIDWYLSEWGDFQYYYDSKINLFGFGINFNAYELIQLDNYILNIYNQIENYSGNQFKTADYFNETKILRAPLNIYRSYIYYLIASEYNNDEYYKKCCDLIKKARSIDAGVLVWFTPESCN